MTTRTAIPTTPTELEEFLGDQKKVMRLLNDEPEGFKELITNYARTAYEKDTDLLNQVKIETERTMTEWLKTNGGTSAKKLNLDFQQKPDNRYHKMANPKAVGAPLNGLFPDLASYLQVVWNSSRRDGNLSEENLDKLKQITNYQEKVPSEGGFLVPEEFRAEILRMSLEKSIVRPRARVVPMNSLKLRFPMVDATSNVSSVFGGIVVYRTEEGAELTESAAAFGSIALEATKQTALAHVTNELVKDWGAFGVFIDEIFPEAMAYYEDVDFLTGNGAGQPLGALNASNTSLIAVAKETGQASTTIVWENIIRMYSRMLPSSLDTAVWIASPDTFVELATMALTVGTGGSAIWLTNGQNKPVLTLLGIPVIMSEKAPAVLGTQGDLSLVDFSMYLIGDRQQMTVDSSPHVKFTSDKTTYRVIQRNDGRPWVQSAFTPKNNGPTLSPFVQLATR
jgi:HK97 family phage major capsid protein